MNVELKKKMKVVSVECLTFYSLPPKERKWGFQCTNFGEKTFSPFQ